MYGIEATPSLLRELRAAHPAGIRLLRRNIETPDQVRELASAVAEAALSVERDPLRLLPIVQGRRAGLLVPRLADVADRIALPDDLRRTAGVLRPGVGASVGVLETAVQADGESVAMAAEWM